MILLKFLRAPRALWFLLPLLGLSACGLAAAPCRVASAGFKVVPVIGPAVAAPTDACANAIDPTPTRS
jgi:hypothetical protein